MKEIKILKFGGSSVENVEAIHRCAEIAQKARHENEKLVIVVSAMGKQTDELLKLAFSVSEAPAQRELDMLVSTGERVSCSLFAMALARLGLKALSLTGSQCGILTNKVHQHADIVDIKCDRLLKSLETYDAIVVAGFQGVDPGSKEITTLGRGGSDLTAVALAWKLGASACFLYTDVNGILTADPKLFSEAEVVPELSWEKAYRLSCLGAKVIHYRASSLAMREKIPLYVINAQDPEGPKTLVKDKDISEVLISYKESQTYLELKGENSKDLESFFKKICDFLWTYDDVPFYLEKKEKAYIFSVKNNLVENLQDFLRGNNTEGVSLELKEMDLLSVALLYEEKPKRDFYEEKIRDFLKGKESLFSQFKEGEILFSLKNEDKKEMVREIFSILKK